MFSYLRRLFTASLLYLLPPFPPSRPYSLPPFPPSLSYSLPPLQHPALWISETVTCLAGLCKLPGMAGTGRSIDHPAVFSPPGPRFSWTVKRVARCVDERVTCMEAAPPPQLHPPFSPSSRHVYEDGGWGGNMADNSLASFLFPSPPSFSDACTSMRARLSPPSSLCV